MQNGSLKIGFVSTRLSGTDGVSLEVDKWVKVLREMGHECYCFAGKSDWPDEHCFTVEEAHFKHPDNREIHHQLFEVQKRDDQTAVRIRRMASFLKDKVAEFVDAFGIDLLILENAWSLPMNIPLGLALTWYIGNNQMPTIGHHHDFWWDRERFLGAPVSDYLNQAFPATHAWVQHVVINSLDRRQLSYRKGISATLIPNVMDFDHPPEDGDDYAADLRKQLDIPGDRYFLLQPTRVVPRKRIEQSIELVRRMDVPATLVVSHEAGDEGMEYKKYLQGLAEMLQVDVRFAAGRFRQQRARDAQGRKIYSLADAYRASDLVTYPSLVEGFGNAFLEAVYYKKPLVMSNYEIFKLDIEPKGFDVICFKSFIPDEIVNKTQRLLEEPERVQECVEHNYHIGERHYSLRTVRQRLQAVLDESLGTLG